MLRKREDLRALKLFQHRLEGKIGRALACLAISVVDKAVSRRNKLVPVDGAYHPRTQGQKIVAHHIVRILLFVDALMLACRRVRCGAFERPVRLGDDDLVTTFWREGGQGVEKMDLRDQVHAHLGVLRRTTAVDIEQGGERVVLHSAKVEKRMHDEVVLEVDDGGAEQFKLGKVRFFDPVGGLVKSQVLVDGEKSPFASVDRRSDLKLRDIGRKFFKKKSELFFKKPILFNILRLLHHIEQNGVASEAFDKDQILLDLVHIAKAKAY